MAIIGEIKSANALGYKGGQRRFIYAACKGCGKERWVRLLKGKPESEFCNSCSHLPPERWKIRFKPREEAINPMIMPCKWCLGGQVFSEFSYEEMKVIHVCIHCGTEHDKDGNLLVPAESKPKWGKHYPIKRVLVS